MPPSDPSREPSAASLREAQGRLFWTWLFALPILLIFGASLAFGAPWPDRLLHDLAMLVLAFPVLFVVGVPLFHLDDGQPHIGTIVDRTVVGLATLGYLSGVTALAGWTPNGAGPGALLVATFLTARHLWDRDLR